MTPFLEVLYNLSHETGLKLYPDQNEACKLVLEGDIMIQLEIDQRGENLLLASHIAELSPGKFRESVLKHALIANTMETPNYGSLCYIEKINMLTLYDFIPLSGLKTEFLLNFIIVFADKVKSWKAALSASKPAPFTLQKFSDDKPPKFGLKT